VCSIPPYFIPIQIVSRQEERVAQIQTQTHTCIDIYKHTHPPTHTYIDDTNTHTHTTTYTHKLTHVITQPEEELKQVHWRCTMVLQWCYNCVTVVLH
jgi:hypothetical protein